MPARTDAALPRLAGTFLALVLALVLALTLALTLASGCGRKSDQERPAAAPAPPPPPSVPVPGGTAVIGFAAEPDVLNSLIRESAYAGQILALLQEGLLEMGEDLSWQPRIAAAWSLAPDSLSVTYELRPWRWADGWPLLARDVVSSFRLFKDPRVASPRAGRFRDVIACEAPSPTTVRYRFSRPQADPLTTTAHAILPAHLTDGLDPVQVRSWPLNEHPLSSGPFVLERWDHDRQIVLARNPYYSGKPARLDRLVFRIIPDETARVLALETGETDFMEEVPPEAAARLEAGDKVRIVRIGGRLFGYLSWNFRNPIFTDRRVRRAFSLAIDRERFVRDLLGGYARPAASPLPPLLWAHDADLAPDPHDPERARALLTEAGWVDTDGDGVREKDGRRLSFEVLTRQGDPVRELGVAVIRQNLAEVGAEVRPRVLEHGTILDLLGHGRFDAYLGVYQASVFVDPSPLVHSRSTDRFNYGAYANAQVDSLCELGLRLSDRAQALPVWRRLQEVLAEDPPMACLYYPETLVAVSRRLQDVRPHALSPYNNVAEWWIAPADRRYAPPPTTWQPEAASLP